MRALNAVLEVLVVNPLLGPQRILHALTVIHNKADTFSQVLIFVGLPLEG